MGVKSGEVEGKALTPGVDGSQVFSFRPRCSFVALCAAFVASLSSCVSATGPIIPALSLNVHLADHQYFDNEPIYAVFQLTNTGTDTVWITPFGLAELSLRVELVRSDGVVFRDWGIIVDYVTAPGWKGVPIAPQRSLYEIAL